MADAADGHHAATRCATQAVLQSDAPAIAPDAEAKVREAVTLALGADEPPVRQTWLLAEHEPGAGRPRAFDDAADTANLRGASGRPWSPARGLRCRGRCACRDGRCAGRGCRRRSARGGRGGSAGGGRIGGRVAIVPRRSGYEPLTLYLAREGLADAAASDHVRPATGDDVPSIVARSALNRTRLAELDALLDPHPAADSRFGAWMRRSLALEDRDMLVIGAPDAIDGYVIAQPASRLHFPPAHDITATGVIDDFFHLEFSDASESAMAAGPRRRCSARPRPPFAARGVARPPWLSVPRRGGLTVADPRDRRLRRPWSA